MLKCELFTALKSKRVIFLFLFFILITGYDLYQNYTYNFHRYLTGEWTSKPTGEDLFHPCFASLNWMSPPAWLVEVDPDEEDREIGVIARWEVNAARTDDRLVIRLFDIVSDTSADLGVDPGLTKDGVEAHLQELLAERVEVLGKIGRAHV